MPQRRNVTTPSQQSPEPGATGRYGEQELRYNRRMSAEISEAPSVVVLFL